MEIRLNDKELETLRRITKASGIKTTHLASRIRVHRSTVYRFTERGQRMGAQAIAALMSALQVTPEDLDKRSA